VLAGYQLLRIEFRQVDVRTSLGGVRTPPHGGYAPANREGGPPRRVRS
jgi:hypothetical protein